MTLAQLCQPTAKPNLGIGHCSHCSISVRHDQLLFVEKGFAAAESREVGLLVFTFGPS
jgi:hypothetical protein